MDKDEFFRRARNDLPGPAHDLRVLECTTTWAGPMAGCVLADLGADVIKVELPQGEVSRNLAPFLPGSELSYVHETVNRNKRCLTLDLRRPRGGTCSSTWPEPPTWCSRTSCPARCGAGAWATSRWLR